MLTARTLRSSLGAATAAMLVVALGATSARAGRISAELRCGLAKLRAAGSAAQMRILCETLETESATRGCLAKAEQALERRFARVEQTGGCLVTGDASGVWSEILTFGNGIRATARGSESAPSRCASGELRAAARAMQQLVRASARDLRSPDPDRLAAAHAAATSDFDAAYANARTRGDCLQPVDPEWTFQQLTREVARLAPGCPCWTSAMIDAEYPRRYFDQEGRGGAVCRDDTLAFGIESVDTCEGRIGMYGGIIFHPARVFVGVSAQRCGMYLNDIDPDDDGRCNGLPFGIDLAVAQAKACVVTVKASRAWQRECGE